MSERTLMSPQQLMTRIGAPDAPVLIDVCIDEDFALDPRLIPGARRHPFAEIEAMVPSLTGREVVLICQKGLKLSQGAAALLRASGIKASALKGGMVEWAALDLPAIPAKDLPSSRIITANQPTNDALATLWLVRRFAVPDTQVLFVEASACDAVADRFDGTPLAGFNETLAAFTLISPGLRQFGAILKGDAPEAAGITMALTGLRTLNPDDLSYLNAAMPLYDALHRAALDANDAITKDGAAA